MGRVTSIAADCSETDSPRFALRQTAAAKYGRLKIKHRWSSETDAGARAFIEANHRPEKLFCDTTERSTDELPDVDCLIVGFPCQPFSALGRRVGLRDRRIHSVYKSILETLRTRRVRSFILENVVGILTHRSGATFAKRISDLEACGFGVKWNRSLSSQFGLPPRRPRVYVMGIALSVGRRPKLQTHLRGCL